MSYHILSETENSFERTIVYPTMHEIFVVMVQQNVETNKKTGQRRIIVCFQKLLWISLLSCQTNLDQPVGVSLHQAVSYHLQYFLTLCILTIYQVYQWEQKKIIYKYVPFYENLLGVLQECDNLADL